MRSAGEVLSTMVAAFDTGDVDGVAEYVDALYVDHQGLGGEEVRGAEGFARVVAVARGSYETLTVSIEDLIEEGDRAACRLRWTGTFANGDLARRETLEMLRVQHGRAVEHWGGRS